MDQSPISEAPVTNASGPDWIERAWRLFVSLKLMVVLMALFALAMAAGTFLNPKEDALVEIEKAFAAKPWVVTVYRVFELYAPFKSWWFTLIIVLLALNNLASSIERLPRIFLLVRNPQKRLTDDVLRGLRLRREVSTPSIDASGISDEFAKSGYRVSRIEENGVTYLFGERGAWTRFGVWAVHLALLVICAGAVWGRMFSFEGMIELPEDGGTSRNIRMREPDGTVFPRPLLDEQGRPFTLRCDDFTLDRFKDGSARRFSSELAVLDDQGQEVVRKRIIVNDPLDYGGMKFYQASYREIPDQSRAVMEIGDRESGEKKPVLASPDTKISLGDGKVSFRVVNYERSFGELGPAVQVVRDESRDDGTKASNSFWVFANHPEFDREFRGDRYFLKFEKLEPAYITGIQVGYDPGIPWIYFGCVVMWAGLFVTFWTAHRRIWARLENGRVTFAGAAHRNKEAFAQEFSALVGRLGANADGTAR